MPDTPPGFVPDSSSAMPPGFVPDPTPPPPKVQPKIKAPSDQDIQAFRDQYFNTNNPKANRPTMAAFALASNPNDPYWKPQLDLMQPVSRIAIQQRAQEIAQEKASPRINQGIPMMGGFGQGNAMGIAGLMNPEVARLARTPQTLPTQVIPAAVAAGYPETQRKVDKGKGAYAAAQIAQSLVEPTNVALMQAIAPLMASRVLGTAVGTAAGIPLAREAGKSAGEGDWLGAGIKGAAALVPPVLPTALRGKAPKQPVLGESVADRIIGSAESEAAARSLDWQGGAKPKPKMTKAQVKEANALLDRARAARLAPVKSPLVGDTAPPVAEAQPGTDSELHWLAQMLVPEGTVTSENVAQLRAFQQHLPRDPSGQMMLQHPSSMAGMEGGIAPPIESAYPTNPNALPSQVIPATDLGPQVGVPNKGRPKGVKPTLPAMSTVDTTQPMVGAEGAAPLGKPPFATTLQETGGQSAALQAESQPRAAKVDVSVGATGKNKAGGGRGKGASVGIPESTGARPSAQTTEAAPTQESPTPAVVSQEQLADIHAKTLAQVKPGMGDGVNVYLADAHKVALKTGAIPKGTTLEQFRTMADQSATNASDGGTNQNLYSPQRASTGSREGPPKAKEGYLRAPKPEEPAPAIPVAPAIPRGMKFQTKYGEATYSGKNVEGKHIARLSSTGDIMNLSDEAASSLAQRAAETKPKKGGTLRSGFGPTGTTGEEPLVTVEKVKGAVHSALDAASNLVSEAAAYTRRTSPEVFNRGLRMVNSAQESEAGVEKLRSVFEKHGFTTKSMREAIGAVVNADKQLTKGVAPAIPESVIAKLASSPKMKAFGKDYMKAVDELTTEQRKAAGYGTNNVYGKHTGLWMPSIALDAEGVPYSKSVIGGGSGLTRPTYTPSKMVGEQEFKGTGTYLNDPLEAHLHRLMGLNRAAGERATIAEMAKSGALQPVSEDGELLYGGEKVKAVKVNLTNWGFTPEEVQKIAPGLTQTVRGKVQVLDMAMPRKVEAEMRPLFQGRSVQTDNPASIYNHFIMAQLYSAGELGAHAVTLPSVAGSAASKGLAGSVPFVNALRGFKKMITPGYSAEDIANANVLAARAGVRRSYPTNPDMTTAQKVKAVAEQPGGAALYSRKGLFNNVVTGVYTMMKKTGSSDAEIVETLRALPGHTKALEAAVPGVLKRAGLGTYYNTGKSVFKQAFNPPGGVKTLAARTAGALAFVTLAGKLADKDHKYWWEQKLGPGEYVAGTDTDGKPIVGTVALDRITRAMLETPVRITKAYQAGATPSQIASEGAVSALSQAVRPSTGGPLSALAQQVSGKAPYGVRNREKYGWEAMDTPSSKLNYTDPDRAWEALKSMIPAAGYLDGGEGQYSASMPKDEKWKVINLWLKRLGQPQFKAQSPDQQRGFEQSAERKRQLTSIRAKVLAGQR